MESVEKPQKLIPEKVVGFKINPMEFNINQNDTIIYALSIGFNEDPLNKKQFRFTYELSDNFSVFPSYVCVIPINSLGELFNACPGIPNFNMMSLLHGEEWVEFHKALPTSGALLFEPKFVDVEDKGKGTVFCIQVKITGKEDNVTYATVYCNIFVRGLKGEGVKSVGPLKQAILKLPKSTPTKEVTVKTTPNQAFYYRIGGNDANPLHVDPDMAGLGGFDKPILHGLCTFGIVAKTAFEEFCDDNIENLLGIKARFTSHVFPGESLKIQFWKNSGNSIQVAAQNVERKTQVLIGEIKLKNAKF